MVPRRERDSVIFAVEGCGRCFAEESRKEIDVIQNRHVQVMWFQRTAQIGVKPTLQRGQLEMVKVAIHVIRKVNGSFSNFSTFENLFFRRNLKTRSKVVVKLTFFIGNDEISIVLDYIRIPIGIHT